jgi:hypothetical protein
MGWMMMDFTTIHAGDELVIGPLKGVRFWTYNIKDMQINSFQWDHVWSPSAPTVDNEAAPTIENERGINVYKSIEDAMRGSADAINDIIEQPDKWIGCGGGIVLGTVEFWGVTVEYEYGWATQVVRPTRFLRAWGARAGTIADELNAIWFGCPHGFTTPEICPVCQMIEKIRCEERKDG